MNDELPEGEKPPARRATDPTGESGLHLIEEIKRSLRLLSIATIVLFVVILATVGYGYYRSNQIHDSLCTLRADRIQAVEGARAFLQEHPNGTPGIPAAAIRSNLVLQQQTVDALSSLNC